MRVVYSKEFLKAVADLPKQIQSTLDERIALLTEDPFHPLLHSKRLKGNLREYHSFRITRE
jgi:mRNA-degrading endonuclease RelE of RelBE toxin-antitoxin system